MGNFEVIFLSKFLSQLYYQLFFILSVKSEIFSFFFSESANFVNEYIKDYFLMVS